MSGEREAVADFVGCAGRGEVAFVKKKLRRHEASEAGWTEDPPFKDAERLAAALLFGASQCDVRMERADLGDETADGGGYCDSIGEGDQFGSEPDVGIEDAGAIEETQLCEMNRDRRGTHFTEACDKAAQLFRLGVAQKLESDVP